MEADKAKLMHAQAAHLHCQGSVAEAAMSMTRANHSANPVRTSSQDEDNTDLCTTLVLAPSLAWTPCWASLLAHTWESPPPPGCSGWYQNLLPEISSRPDSAPQRHVEDVGAQFHCLFHSSIYIENVEHVTEEDLLGVAQMR